MLKIAVPATGEKVMKISVSLCLAVAVNTANVSVLLGEVRTST